MIATLIQTLIFLTYTLFIIYNFGVIHSISESWYKLERKLKPLFTFFCWGIGLPMLAQMNPAMDDSGVLFFLSAAGFAFVGAATMFKSLDGFTKITHYTGAGVGILFGLLGLGVQYNLWILLYIGVPLAIVILIAAKFKKLKNPIWWLEILAAILILIGLWIK